MLSHLGYKDGQNTVDIGSCPKVPPRIRALFAASGGLVPESHQLNDEVGNDEHRIRDIAVLQNHHLMPDGLDVANETPPLVLLQNSTQVE